MAWGYRIPLLVPFYAGILEGVVNAQDTVTATSTVTETVTYQPLFTATLGDYCPPFTLPFCPYAASSLAATPTETILPPNADDFFVIQVEAIDPTASFPANQYLLILEDYATLINSSTIAGWAIGGEPVFIDDNSFTNVDRSLIFDNAGTVLGVAPLDAPPANVFKRAPEDEDVDPLSLRVAGTYVFPNPTPVTTFSRWGRFSPTTPTATAVRQPIRPVDEQDRPIDVHFLGCRKAIPDPPTATIWHLNAVYDLNAFYASSATASPQPTECVEVQLVGITKSRPTPFAIRANIQGEDSDSTLPGPFLYQVNNSGVVGRTEDPTYFIYSTERNYILVEETFDIFEILASIDEGDSNNSTLFRRALSNSSSHIAERALKRYTRFNMSETGEIRILEGENIVDIPFVGCPLSDTNSTVEEYSLGATFNLTEFLRESPSCRVISLTTETSVPRPTETSSAGPNVSVCNNLNYDIAYTTTGSVNELATECYCWSFIATTTDSTSTALCTPTVVEIVPIVTSIQVSGVFGVDSDTGISDDIHSSHSITARQVTIEVTSPGAVTATESPATQSDIITVPTPTAFTTAAASDVSSSCSALFESDSIELLTVTEVEIISVTVTVLTRTETETQTICFEDVYVTELTTFNPVIVACPASVTATVAQTA